MGPPEPLDLGSVNVPNVSWMVAILVHHHVPILDNGGTGLIPGLICYALEASRMQVRPGIRILIEQYAQAWNLLLILPLKCRGMGRYSRQQGKPYFKFSRNKQHAERPQATGVGIGRAPPTSACTTVPS